MKITAEISIYPLEQEYDQAVLNFLDKLSKKPGIKIETNAMSTLIYGDYDDVVNIFTSELKTFLENHKAVSFFKISNGCHYDPDS